jgi:acyl dehydratase
VNPAGRPAARADSVGRGAASTGTKGSGAAWTAAAGIAPSCHAGNQEITERYLEDFDVGQVFGTRRLAVAEERIKSFAAEFDPRPFHRNEESARHTIFRGLAASGWHTAAATMRLLVDSEIKPAGDIVGAGRTRIRSWSGVLRLR